MLKKHNKLIMLLVLVTFMFTIVGSAGAATFSDVTGASAESAAIYKLNSLGIIDGYPDGTFGPEKTITRAEFAKIACVTAGLKSVASGMGGTASPFSDVATNHWANGWINVAAAQGYVKGDPAGTFRPEDQITQAEVVTVLLRILGYNDNLAGEWPSDYIAKAANLGILDDVTFMANQAATRGVVAVIAAATLGENMVTYIASDNYFSEGTTPTTLMVKKFSDLNNVVEDKLVTDVNLANGTVKLALLGVGSLEVDPACVYVNATGWGTAAYRYVDYIYDTDKKAIVYIKVKDYEVIKGVKLDKIEVATAGTAVAGKVNGAKIEIDGKKYDVAADFTAPQSDPAGVAYNFTQLAAGTVLKTWVENWVLPAGNGLNLQADSADFVLNEDGEIGFVKSNAWPTQKYVTNSAAPNLFNTIGIVDEVNTKNMKITTKGQGSITLDKDDSELYFITLNGKKAELKDLQENDLVYELPTKYNVQFIVAVRLAVKGTLESLSKNADGTLKSVTISGTKYDVAKNTSPFTNLGAAAPLGGAYLSTDEGDTFALATGAATEDLLGNDVTVMLNPVQKVGAIISAAGSSGKIYGVINDDSKQTLVNGGLQSAIEVALADGSFATYSYDEDSEIWDAGVWKSLDNTFINAGVALDNNVFVQLTLNADGYIDQIKYGAGFATAVGAAVNVESDKDNNVVMIGTTSYSADNMVAFNLTRDSDGDIVVINNADFLDKLDGAAIAAGVGAFAKTDSGELNYLVVNGAGFSATSSNYCMIESIGVNSDGDFVNILLPDDTTKRYQVNSGAFTDDTVFRYELVSGEIKALGAGNIHAAAYTVKDVNGSILTLTSGGVDTNFYVDSDTLYFDNSDDDPVAAVLGDLAAGDAVKIYRNDATGSLDAVEIY